MEFSVEGLTGAAEAGDASAQRRLAFALAGKGWSDEAKRWLIRASNGGDAEAMTQIGLWLLAGDHAPFSPPQGAVMILGAAEKDYPPALTHAAVMLATGVIGTPDWDAGLSALRKAAALGEPLAVRQLDVLKDLPEPAAPPPAEPISDTPCLWWVRGLAPLPVCRWVMERGAERRDAATDFHADGVGGDYSKILFKLTLAETDMVTLWLRTRIAAALGAPRDFLENSNVLRYRSGQTLARHFDFLQPEGLAEIQTKGQRVTTCLTYLNDDYEGGQTEFVDLAENFRGRPGDTLFFRNADPVTGRGDRTTLHASLPIISGEKWVLSQFVRNRPQAHDR